MIVKVDYLELTCYLQKLNTYCIFLLPLMGIDFLSTFDCAHLVNLIPVWLLVPIFTLNMIYSALKANTISTRSIQ